jgi:hypothetical protein
MQMDTDIRILTYKHKNNNLEQEPLSLVRVNEELLERKSSGSGLEN